MKNEKTPLISFITGIIASIALCIAFILQFLYPTPPGHHSALYSSAGSIIFILAMASFILGPIALFTGISCIRKVSKGKMPLENRRVAIIGTIFGAAASSVHLLGFILVFWILITKGIK